MCLTLAELGKELAARAARKRDPARQLDREDRTTIENVCQRFFVRALRSPPVVPQKKIMPSGSGSKFTVTSH